MFLYGPSAGIYCHYRVYDIITGMAIVMKPALLIAWIDPIDFNSNRTHFSLAIRNVVMSIFAPFSQARMPMAGVHVLLLIAGRWPPK